ncbi:hypothetical protein RCOM_1433880 [Ricinus communis]|uniref:Translation initiation factor beta propellor-like domain-containing protein n=1 Tax=Ricinus communis TaxID=3988 RepID=B9RFD5_RICCO|nr:hypothetical protein RCOM_1433880 [Ricinus communis]
MTMSDIARHALLGEGNPNVKGASQIDMSKEEYAEVNESNVQNWLKGIRDGGLNTMLFKLKRNKMPITVEQKVQTCETGCQTGMVKWSPRGTWLQYIMITSSTKLKEPLFPWLLAIILGLVKLTSLHWRSIWLPTADCWIVRWSADEKCLALIEKNILCIYADETLVGHPIALIRNVIDFCWPPTDPFIALLRYDDSAGDVKFSSSQFYVQLSIVKVPEGKNVGTKKLNDVGHFKIYCKEQREYVACTFKSLEEKKRMDTGILIIEVGEQKSSYVPSSLSRRCSHFPLNLEGAGSLLSMVTRKMHSSDIMELDNLRYNLQHSPLSGMQANALYWSPTGGLIVFSGRGDFCLYDVNKMKILVEKEYTPIAVEWSPSGRFVATYGINRKIAVWQSSGKFMYLASHELLMASRKKQVSAQDKLSEEIKEWQLVSVDEKPEKKTKLFEMDFYPDDDKNSQSRFVALKNRGDHRVVEPPLLFSFIRLMQGLVKTSGRCNSEGGTSTIDARVRVPRRDCPLSHGYYQEQACDGNLIHAKQLKFMHITLFGLMVRLNGDR